MMLLRNLMIIRTSWQISTLKNAVKEKNKKLSEAIRAQKDMADKLVDLEGKVYGDNSNMGQKFKTASTKLNDKTKELKTTQEELKTVIGREKKLQECMNDKNSKIADLEATVTRMKLRLEHSTATQKVD